MRSTSSGGMLRIDILVECLYRLDIAKFLLIHDVAVLLDMVNVPACILAVCCWLLCLSRGECLRLILAKPSQANVDSTERTSHPWKVKVNGQSNPVRKIYSWRQEIGSEPAPKNGRPRKFPPTYMLPRGIPRNGIRGPECLK